MCVRERDRETKRGGENSKAADLSPASLCPMGLGAVHFPLPLKLFRVGLCPLRNFVFYRFFFDEHKALLKKLLPSSQSSGAWRKQR